MKTKCLFLFLFLFTSVISNAQQVDPQTAGAPRPLLTNIRAHDPVMFKQDDTYYLFYTGNGINVYSSKNMITWQQEKPVFATAPQWAKDTLKGFTRNSIWAPDISYNKKTKLYYLYYTCSLMGKATSAIGVATNKTLHPDDPDFKWVDHGMVLRSYEGKTNWNAIDPNLIVDEKGTPWLAFGSHWDGLKIVQLTQDQLSVAGSLENIPTIVTRRKTPVVTTTISPEPGDNSIEGSFIFKKNGYYYFFASIDYCCRGINSTYKMIVGRSKKVTGPYVDKDGVEMAKGGGTIVLKGDSLWHGVGHNAVCTFNGTDYLIFHGYDALDNGTAKLRIEKMTWDKDKWPVVVVEYPFMVKPRS